MNLKIKLNLIFHNEVKVSHTMLVSSDDILQSLTPLTDNWLLFQRGIGLLFFLTQFGRSRESVTQFGPRLLRRCRLIRFYWNNPRGRVKTTTLTRLLSRLNDDTFLLRLLLFVKLLQFIQRL